MRLYFFEPEEGMEPPIYRTSRRAAETTRRLFKEDTEPGAIEDEEALAHVRGLWGRILRLEREINDLRAKLKEHEE